MARSPSRIFPLPLVVLTAIGLLAGSSWLLKDRILSSLDRSFLAQPNGTSLPQDVANQTASKVAENLKLDPSLPDPKELTIDGSVTMLPLMKQLQIAYTQINPALPTSYGIPNGTPRGSNPGINALTSGTAWIAASSRPLYPQEQQMGLQGIPIARDALAIVVGTDNPFTGSLTMEQLKQIFQRQITNWSQVGGPNVPIRVINRGHGNGAHNFFQEVVLSGQNFAPDGQNFSTMSQDGTTVMLRALGTDGIGYASIQQVRNQKTVRVIPIEGITPDPETVKNAQYPLSRVLYLVAKPRTSPAVKQFIEMTLSPKGQRLIEQAGFLPL